MAFDFEKAVTLRNEGRTFKEISTILDVSHGYVRQRLTGVPKGGLNVRLDVIAELQRIRSEIKTLEEILADNYKECA